MTLTISPRDAEDLSADAAAFCRHCGRSVSPESDGFCCSGCAAAHRLIQRLGLSAYYWRRSLDPTMPPPRPETTTTFDAAGFVLTDRRGVHSLQLTVGGLHCAACVWLIESVFAEEPCVEHARLNMTTHRLTLRWRGAATDANRLVGRVTSLGYRLVPFDPALLQAARCGAERELLRALAVAGFAFGNVMLLSISIWSGVDMGVATRDLLHWVSALIALPAIIYAGLPFFRSAFRALAAGRSNMDVPISIGVTLASGMSLYETINSGVHAYFDSAVALLFFLLIGRYLDLRARGRARSMAAEMLALQPTAALVCDPDCGHRLVAPGAVRLGDTVLVAAGQRVPIDGIVTDGRSEIDVSLVTGETTPQTAGPGDRVFAGVMNLSAPLHLTVTAIGESSCSPKSSG